MLRYLLTRSLRETAFPQNEHQTTAPAYARRFSARNWIIPSAYASAYALALLQFAYASLRNSGFGLREASYDTTLSTHVKGGLGRCSYVIEASGCPSRYDLPGAHYYSVDKGAPPAPVYNMYIYKYICAYMYTVYNIFYIVNCLLDALCLVYLKMPYA